MAVRLYAVNGTGPSCSTQYKQEFANSFCNRVVCRYREKVGYYRRGPEKFDRHVKAEGVLTTSELADRIVREVDNDDCSVKYSGSDLVFAGYSRGGAAVILAAKRLKDRGRNVAHMFLFDAVDRARNLSSTSTIPTNVQNLYLLRREPDVYSRLADQHLRTTRQHFTTSQRLTNAAVGASAALSIGQIPLAIGGALSKGLPSGFTKKEDELIADELRAAGRDEFVQSSHDDFDSIPFGNTGERSMAEFTKIRRDIRVPGSHGAMGGTPWTFTYAKAYQHHEDLAVGMIEQMFLPDFERVMAR